MNSLVQGAQASPLQCVPLADSCLALGAASCRRAKTLLEDLCENGSLGPLAKVHVLPQQQFTYPPGL